MGPAVPEDPIAAEIRSCAVRENDGSWSGAGSTIGQAADAGVATGHRVELTVNGKVNGNCNGKVNSKPRMNAEERGETRRRQLQQHSFDSSGWLQCTLSGFGSGFAFFQKHCSSFKLHHNCTVWFLSPAFYFYNSYIRP